MAVRNYKAEEARRNLRAKAAGFTSRAQLRHAIETGNKSALAPERVTSPRTMAAQSARFFRALDWNAMHGATDMTLFDPSAAEDLGVTKGEYIDAYMAAFVEGPQRYATTRRKGGSPAMDYWFVELNDFYTEAEYDGRY